MQLKGFIILQLLHSPEAYLEASQNSKMELFVKIVWIRLCSLPKAVLQFIANSLNVTPCKADQNASCIMYQYSSWRRRFGKSWDCQKYKNLNILNIIFLWNKKILNLCLRWQILRSYCFVVEVTTFKQSCFKIGYFVQCLERCFDKSNIFTSFEKEIRVKLNFFVLFCSNF